MNYWVWLNHSTEILCIPEYFPASFGQNITIPCGDFQLKGNDIITSVKWYFTCSDCGAAWSLEAQLVRFPVNAKNNNITRDMVTAGRPVSASSGALSVLNVQATDEGYYKCESTGSKPYIVELKSPCEFAVVLKQYIYIYILKLKQMISCCIRLTYLPVLFKAYVGRTEPTRDIYFT